MFNYLINRWIIARRFKKVDAGYVYRRRPDLPGIVLTEEERQETLREYRRRYWRFWILFLAGIFVAMFAATLAIMAFDLDEKSMTIVSYGFCVVMLVFILKEQREWSFLPEKRFADRPRVASDLPTGGWLVRFQNLSRRRSWPAYALLIAIYGTAVWLLIPQSLDTSSANWFFLGCFAVGFVVLIYGAILKTRQPPER